MKPERFQNFKDPKGIVKLICMNLYVIQDFWKDRNLLDFIQITFVYFKDELKSYGFATTWGCINVTIFIFVYHPNNNDNNNNDHNNSSNMIIVVIIFFHNKISAK